VKLAAVFTKAIERYSSLTRKIVPNCSGKLTERGLLLLVEISKMARRWIMQISSFGFEPNEKRTKVSPPLFAPALSLAAMRESVSCVTSYETTDNASTNQPRQLKQ
jgi:hypothetical protein